MRNRMAAPRARPMGVWRVGVELRLFFSATGLAFLYGGTYLMSPTAPGDAPEPGFAVLCFALAVGFWVIAWRPRLRLFPDRLEARGLLLRRVIPIEQVHGARTSRDGLIIDWGDECRTTVTLVGEVGPIGAALGLDRRPNRMLGLIRRQVDAAGAGRSEQPTIEGSS